MIESEGQNSQESVVPDTLEYSVFWVPEFPCSGDNCRCHSIDLSQRRKIEQPLDFVRPDKLPEDAVGFRLVVDSRWVEVGEDGNFAYKSSLEIDQGRTFIGGRVVGIEELAESEEPADQDLAELAWHHSKPAVILLPTGEVFGFDPSIDRIIEE